MIRHAHERHERNHASFRHFFDQNALTLWAAGMAVLASMMALPALI